MADSSIAKPQGANTSDDLKTRTLALQKSFSEAHPGWEHSAEKVAEELAARIEGIRNGKATSESELAQLACDPNPSIRYWTALCESTPAEAIGKLASDANRLVQRRALDRQTGKNPGEPQEMEITIRAIGIPEDAALDAIYVTFPTGQDVQLFWHTFEENNEDGSLTVKGKSVKADGASADGRIAELDGAVVSWVNWDLWDEGYWDNNPDGIPCDALVSVTVVDGYDRIELPICAGSSCEVD